MKASREEPLIGIKRIFLSMGVSENAITLDAHLLKDLGLDSLDLADLVMRMEEAYDIKIDYEATEALHCVADVVNYVENELGKKAGRQELSRAKSA